MSTKAGIFVGNNYSLTKEGWGRLDPSAIARNQFLPTPADPVEVLLDSKSPLPMVLLVHGGPWARDYWGFNQFVQLLASRGYAVLQPN